MLTCGDMSCLIKCTYLVYKVKYVEQNPVDLRVGQIQDVDDRVLLNDEVGKEQERNQDEEGCEASEDENKAFCPIWWDHQVNQVLDQGPD